MKHEKIFTDLISTRDPRFPPKDRFMDIVLGSCAIPDRELELEFATKLKKWQKENSKSVDYLKMSFEITNEFYPAISHRAHFWVCLSVFLFSILELNGAIQISKRAMRDLRLWSIYERGDDAGVVKNGQIICNGISRVSSLILQGADIPSIEGFYEKVSDFGGLLIESGGIVGSPLDKLLSYTLLLDYRERMFNQKHPHLRKKVADHIELIYSGWGGESGYFVNSRHPVWRKIEV